MNKLRQRSTRRLLTASNATVELLEKRRLLASLSGFAFIDANGNGQRDAAEYGLPGVRIELTNSAETATEETITTDIGFYAFTNLPSGNYTVTAFHPEAVLDGVESTTFPGAQVGDDVISNIQLSESDIVREINFGEGAIKSEYVSPIWVLSSSATNSVGAMLRGVIAGAEQVTGNVGLAEQIRANAERGAVSQPVATMDRYSVIAGDELVVAPSNGLLQNDLHPTDGVLSAVLLEPPANGTLSLSTDGSFTYASNTDFAGVESFTYQAVGDVGSNPTTVLIDVAPPPNRPPTTNSDRFEVQEDEVLTIQAPGVLANDTDLDGDSLTVSLAFQPTNGLASLSPDGSFTFTPDPDFFGNASFSYVASDGEFESLESPVQITVLPVNDAPLGLDDAYVTNENEPLAIESADGVLINDVDVDGDTLQSILRQDAVNGSVELGLDGAFSYTPNPGFSGLDSFTYVASDGTDVSEILTVTIDVGSVNDAPVANADSFTTDEDVALVASNLTVLSNDSDLDGDPITASLEQQATHGTVRLNMDGTFHYTPNPDFNGTDSFSYVASDGLRLSEVATVTITVNPVNDAPVAIADEYTVNQGETLSVDVANGVLSNDSDIENDPLVVSVLNNPGSGQLVLESDGAFEFTPPLEFAGTVTFSYEANDGATSSSATLVTIIVNRVNSAPQVSADTYEVDQDTVLIVSASDGVLANDSDEDGDQLSGVLTTQPENGSIDFQADGSFTYTPTAGFNGTDSFGYTANDGTEATESTATITVRPVAVTITDTVTLSASKDNSLFESATGGLSNGAGEYLFVGKTLQAENFLRRGMIAFDFSSIPDGATITNVSLTLNMSRTIVGAFDVTLHRVAQDWGEGQSDALAEEGTGIDSAENDVTWLHTFFNSQLWDTPGGDFAAEDSASTSVDGVGFYTWNSAQMAADVQSWLDDPATNAGWLLLTDENDISAKRFDSRENATEVNRPRLVVEYEFTSSGSGEPAALSSQASELAFADMRQPEAHPPGDTDGDGLVTFADFLRLADNFGTTDEVFSAADGDFDGDGSVGFSDFLLLSERFGR